MSGSQKFVLILSIIGFIVTLVSTGFHLSSIASIILPILMFYCARNIRQQGRMQNGSN